MRISLDIQTYIKIKLLALHVYSVKSLLYNNTIQFIK